MTIILLALTSLLTACSTLKSSPGTPTQQGPVVIESADLPVPVNNTVETSAIDVEPDPVEMDVLERIRRGFAFPDIDSKYTQDYVKWSVEHPSYLTDLFARAEPFLYYLVEEIDRRDLPMELALLPAIESSYKPNAISSSSAGGLWQFIPSTGKDFGLEQDWWYDGRRDFIDSTKAALDYLTQLNALFEGDWYLTLAAYNAGQGTVLRAIRDNKRRGKNTNYQDLDLRDETKRYLPKLQALKNIVKDPARYDVALAKIENQTYFEVVSLPGQIDIHQFSELAGLDVNTVKHMNAGHLRWATPPAGPHRLLLPLSNQMQTLKALEQIKTSPSVAYHRHTISAGETLSQISSRYGVSVRALQSTNKLASTRIRAGRTLMIPVTNVAPPASLLSSVNDDSNNQVIHRVVKGDTLWSISKRYNVELNQLLNWNQLTKNQILKLNQSLLIFFN